MQVQGVACFMERAYEPMNMEWYKEKRAGLNRYIYLYNVSLVYGDRIDSLYLPEQLKTWIMLTDGSATWVCIISRIPVNLNYEFRKFRKFELLLHAETSYEYLENLYLIYELATHNTVTVCNALTYENVSKQEDEKYAEFNTWIFYPSIPLAEMLCLDRVAAMEVD
ncbi:hypothetical protein L596_006566 [Steinernema carpocapsae]|uniref:Uncharacterized protein n=1 Tax=Steinernema carpocapsae TaxID=34508 RepID=A0A4U8V9Q3_STECR|nr:hypothetical protein L596_006566 [Steinernema carpocapsae]